MSSFSPWMPSFVRTVGLIVAMLMLGLAARAYRSEQLLVLAEGGRKTIRDYESLLTASIKFNPWNGPARLRFADLMLSQQNYQQTVKQLLIASPGRNHWKGWERLGTVYERMAFQPEGTDAEIARALDYYDSVLNVYPTHERGLERRSILALRLGEWHEVENYASRLQELDANNSNVIYMRGRAAEAAGHADIAYHLYTQLTADGISTGTLYSHDDVVERLNSLKFDRSE